MNGFLIKCLLKNVLLANITKLLMCCEYEITFLIGCDINHFIGITNMIILKLKIIQKLKTLYNVQNKLKNIYFRKKSTPFNDCRFTQF
jgi:hypothetical protein